MSLSSSLRTVAFGFLLTCTGAAIAGLPVQEGLQLELVDTASGRTLPAWEHDARRWVAGEPGARYALRIRNTSARRLLAVISVDGVNVLSGATAAHAQRGYVFEPGAMGTIDGWRKSLSQTAAFYFTELPDSFAARTGRPQNVGVIGVAVFEEYLPPAIAMTAPPAPAGVSKHSAETMAGAAESETSSRERRSAAAPRLGTGHGERLHSVVTTTQFQRASTTPSQVITVHYDRLSALIARGIVPPPALAEPNPFPQQFVPDPIM